MSISSIIAISSLGLNILILASTIGGYIKLAKNDIYHQGVAIGDLSKKMDTVLQRISTLEGRCIAHAEQKSKKRGKKQ